MLTWPVASLGWVTSIVQRSAASQKLINEFLQEEPKLKILFLIQARFLETSNLTKYLLHMKTQEFKP